MTKKFTTTNVNYLTWQGAVALWSNASALDRKIGGSKLAANSYFERTTKTREKDETNL